MMLKRYRFLLILLNLLLLVNCNRQKNDSEDEVWADDAVKAVSRLFSINGKSLAKKYQLEYVADTVSMPGGPVRKLGLTFDIRRTLTKSEARRLLYNMGTDFLSMINNDKQLYPYLIDKPFLFKNIEIAIFIFDSNRNKVFDPNLGVAQVINGNFIFLTNNPAPPHRFYKEYKETYEEAKAILDKEDGEADKESEQKKNDA